MNEHSFLKGPEVHPATERTYSTIADRDSDTPLDLPIPPETIVPPFQVTENLNGQVRVNLPVVTYWKMYEVTPSVLWTQETIDINGTLADALAKGNTTGGNDIIVDAGDKITLTDSPTVGTDATNKDYADGIGSTVRITGDTTLALTPKNVFCDTDGGAIALGLPAGVAGIPYRISNTGSSSLAVTIAPDGAELLLGENSSFTLTDGDVLIIVYETTEGWV